MPRLLLITFYFPPWGMGGVQRVAKFAKYLPEFGWDVTVLTADAGGYHQDDPSLLDGLPASVRIERIAYRDPAGRSAQAGGIARSLARATGRLLWWPDRHRGFARAATARAEQLQSENAFDAVMTSSPPPSIHLAGLHLAKSIPWVADFRDPWQARLGDYGPTPLQSWYNRSLHARILRTADAAIAVTPELCEVFRRQGSGGGLSTIPNGFDEADFRDISPSPTADEIVIVCPGTFSEFSPPQPIFRAIAQWRKGVDKRVRLVHVGHSIGVDAARLASDCALGDIYKETGYLPHREAISWLIRANVIAISYNDTPALAVSVPGRVYEALRSLKLIVAFTAPDGALAHLLANRPGCRVVAPRDVESGARAFSASLSAHAPRTLESVKPFDRRAQAEQLSEILNDVVERRQGRAR